MGGTWRLIVVLSIVALAGCSAQHGSSSFNKVELENAIRAADVALDEAVAARDVGAFRSLIAEETAFYGAGGILTVREDVVNAWSVYFDPESKTTLRWSPKTAEVAASGDLGFTRGEYSMVSPGDEGDLVTSRGDYVTIWRKNSDGVWQAIVDIGNPRNEG